MSFSRSTGMSLSSGHLSTHRQQSTIGLGSFIHIKIRMQPTLIQTYMKFMKRLKNWNISDKDEVVNAKVSFNYNDRSGKVDVSEVITYYTKDGVVDSLHGNKKYECGEKIIVNDNMVLVANYIERVKPAKFPKVESKVGYEFLGWYDGLDRKSVV